jgi:hypothetical protein
VTAAEKFNELAAKYSAVSATSPEGVEIARAMDALKRDLAEERARAAPPPKSRRPWRGRVPEAPQREHRRRYAPPPRRPSADHQAAAAHDDGAVDDGLAFGGLS